MPNAHKDMISFIPFYWQLKMFSKIIFRHFERIHSEPSINAIFQYFYLKQEQRIRIRKKLNTK